VIKWNAPLNTNGLPIELYIIYQVNAHNALDELARTKDSSTLVIIENLLPGLNYTIAVAAVIRQLERLFEGNVSNPVTFKTMNGSKYI